MLKKIFVFMGILGISSGIFFQQSIATEKGLVYPGNQCDRLSTLLLDQDGRISSNKKFTDDNIARYKSDPRKYYGDKRSGYIVFHQRKLTELLNEVLSIKGLNEIKCGNYSRHIVGELSSIEEWREKK